MKTDFYDDVLSIHTNHPEYHVDAYRFLYLATSPLSYLLFPKKKRSRVKHLSAKEYYEKVCELALHEYGPMAIKVFEHWGLKQTKDIANATYYMIEAGLLYKQQKESKADFIGLKPLSEALSAPFTRKDTSKK